jgi:hypothetical protein
MFESGGGFVMGFENVLAAYDAEAKKIALDWSELPGLTAPDSVYGQWTSVQAVGGDPRADNLAWLVARSDVERAASELFNYTKVGGRWQRAKNREGFLAWSHRFYSTRADGSTVAVKEWELGDDAISLEYEDDSPKARKLWAKFEAERKAHPISIEVVYVNGTSSTAAPELPVVDSVTGFVVTTSGDAYAAVRVTDWVDAKGNSVPREDGLKPGAYVLRWAGATGKPVIEAVPGMESENVADVLLAADGDTVWAWGAHSGEPYRAFLAKHETSGWASVEPPLGGKLGLDRVAQTSDGRVWIVAGDWERREKKLPTLFTRGKDETAWIEVPMPEVSFATDAQDRIELGWEEWEVLKGSPENAATRHYAEAFDIEAVGADLWVVARVESVEVLSNGYSATRTVLFTTAPIQDVSSLPSVSRTWLELRNREGGGDRKPGDNACREVYALLEPLPADAAPEVDVKATLDALKKVENVMMPAIVDGHVREQRGVWGRLIVDSPKEAKSYAKALSKALGRSVTTHCEVPIPTRILDTAD